jgi:alpha-beta hydrolase superfamily lysophospholipase
VSFEREVLTTPDDDDLVLDHMAGPADAPRVVLLHGLEGDSGAVYIQGLARGIAAAGMRATVLNFRSCARDARGKLIPNRRPRLYHSGDTKDVDFVVRTLEAREPRTPLLAVGVSLGGNVLLKWLGEQGARSPVEAAATISVPYDLAAASRHLERGFARLYAAHFLKPLKRKALDILRRFPRETEHINRDRIRFAQTLYTFDAARFSQRDRLLQPLELDALPRRHRGADPVREQRGRSVPAGRGVARCARPRLRGRPLRGQQVGRSRRLHRGPLALAPELLGRGQGPRLAALAPDVGSGSRTANLVACGAMPSDAALRF